MGAARKAKAPAGPLEIGLLGPLQVSIDHHLVPLTSGRLRTLLASLAMSAGDSVSIDRLANAMWDGHVPDGARKAVQLYVARLRAELGADLIDTSQSGYVLRAATDQVDALRFARLLDAAASSACRSTEHGLLVEALTLWRGAPFEDLRSPWLDVSIAPRLVERYLSATERRIDLDIADGRAAELVVELGELTARHPLRESLWLRRLVVLERCGRRAEALAQYETVRSQLAEELGADPGPELQRVHADLLAGRTPPTARSEGAASPWLVPQQLPADIDGFTGRGAALQWFDECLDPDEGLSRRPVAIAAIAGAAGIGKSALAIHAAHQHASRFPDGQLYVDLQAATAGLRPVTPLEVLGRFLRVLGAEASAIPTDLDEASAAFRSRVADRRLLVVLDNAADAAQVRPLVPAGSGCAVLVTSRAVLSGLDGARHLHLDVLEPAEAVDLLGRLAGHERVAAEPEAAADVARCCAWLPLALRIAGARLAARPTWPVRAMADRLADAQRRLDELETADAGARASFAVSYDQLRASADPVDQAAAGAFGLLGMLDGPEVGVPAMASLLDVPHAAAERVLERLVDVRLLETPAPGRYRLHDLLRLYARELAQQKPEHERRAALTRVLAFYLATVRQTLALLRPGDFRLDRVDHRWRDGGLSFADDQAALTWLEAERANLVAAVYQAASEPGLPDEIATQLAHMLYGFFMVRGHWGDWAQINQIALDVARAKGDRVAEAQVHSDLGVRNWRLGRYEDAMVGLQESLAIRRSVGDRPGQAASMANLGLVHLSQGRYEQALACQRECLAISRSIGDPRGEAAGLHNIGEINLRLARYDEASACLLEGLALHRQMGDRRTQASTFNGLGALYARQGRYEQAMTTQHEGLALFRQLGDRDGEAVCLADIGVVHRRQGRHERSLDRLRESLSIREQLGDQRGQSEVLREIGVTLRDIGRIDDARAHWQQALATLEQLPAVDDAPVRSLLAELPRGA